MIKKILVCEKNRPQIEAAIKAAEGKATARCATYADVMRAAKSLSYVGSSLRCLEGSTVTYMPGAEKVARAYKWMPMGTYVTVLCHGSRFYLIDVGRKCSNLSLQYRYHLSDSAKENLIWRIENGYND